MGTNNRFTVLNTTLLNTTLLDATLLNTTPTTESWFPNFPKV
jgi:hypothetical protein